MHIYIYICIDMPYIGMNGTRLRDVSVASFHIWTPTRVPLAQVLGDAGALVQLNLQGYALVSKARPVAPLASTHAVFGLYK